MKNKIATFNIDDYLAGMIWIWLWNNLLLNLIANCKSKLADQVNDLKSIWLDFSVGRCIGLNMKLKQVMVLWFRGMKLVIIF